MNTYTPFFSKIFGERSQSPMGHRPLHTRTFTHAVTDLFHGELGLCVLNAFKFGYFQSCLLLTREHANAFAQTGMHGHTLNFGVGD